jgi:hypothetical protein
LKIFQDQIGENLTVKLNKPETNSKDKNIGLSYMDNNGFKNGYQLTTDRVKNDKGDQVLDTHRVFIE